MVSQILEIMKNDSEELIEAKKNFNRFFGVYSSISSWQIFKSVFYPLKLIWKNLPELSEVDVILDCTVQEKYKRMTPLLPDKKTWLLHCSDLSTLRNQRFYSLAPKPKIFYRARIPGYWKMLPTLLVLSWRKRDDFESLGKSIAFYVKATQELIHYQLLLKRTKAQVLLTANEDSWLSTLTSKLCRKLDVLNINVMHGRAYDGRQFYSHSLVFGKECFKDVIQKAGPETTVLQIRLPEIEDQFPIKSGGVRRIVFFDQPTFWKYGPQEKQQFAKFLQKLKDMGFEVAVKTHPTQTKEHVKIFENIEILEGLSLDTIFEANDLAITYCSTVGLEAIARGVPTLFLNINSILDEFLQVKFLKSISPLDLEKAIHMISEFKSEAKLSDYFEREKQLLQDEYRGRDQFSLSDILRKKNRV